MKLVCLSFTDRGIELGEKLAEHNIDHYANNQLDGGVKGFLKKHWKDYDGFIFISSTGIAIRMINPYIMDKTIDPAIVAVDDMGRFSISLLSGHLGGANELAKDIGGIIGAIPVISTASDNRGIESVDIFAKKNDYYMEDMALVKKLTSIMVNGGSIGFFSEERGIIDYPKTTILEELVGFKELEGLIIVSSMDYTLDTDIPIAYLRPRNINIGIGCRKDVDGSRIIEAIESSLKGLNLSSKSIKAIGTVEVKKDERGIIEAAKYYNCPMKIFTLEDIRKVEDRFEKSQFVKDTIGVYSVSEPVAYLLGGSFLAMKLKHNGITISISKEVKNG